MIGVALTWDEVEDCAHKAIKRYIRNRKLGTVHRFGARGTRLDHEFHGYLGEYAVAKHFDIVWDGGLPGAGDVGICEVRSTDWATGKLVLHKTDSDDAPFILARCHDLPFVWLVGWVMGEAGKRQEWWGDVPGQRGREAYWVPNEALRDMRELTQAHLIDEVQF